MEDNEKNVDIVLIPHGPSESEGEAASVKARQSKVKQALQSLAMNVAENCSPPVIAVMGSGGGLRAMVGLLGTFTKLAEIKLLDAVTYVSGTSGSTWCLSSLCHEKKWSEHAFLEYMENYISNRLKCSWDWKKGWRKVQETFLEEMYSLTNIWAYLIVNAMIKEINEGKLSGHKEGCESGENPYPIYSSVQKESLGKNDPGAWFEFTPHLSGFPAYGCFVKTELLGSKFEAGKLLTKNPENELCYLDGLWGSAFANDMVIRDNIKDLFHRVINGTGGRGENILTLFAEEEIQHDPVCKCTGCDKIRELLMQNINEIPEEKEKSWLGLSEALDEALEKLQEERQADSPFSAGICHGFKILKLTLDCLTQWKWGTMNNFLYKWKSKQKGNIPSALCSKEHIFLIDAGLEINTAFPLILPPYRKIDLILSFDFSQGDPFATLKQTAEYCEKNRVPFPKINIEDNDEDIPSKCCYIFEGDGSGAPDVMHFPLFNNQTCEGIVEEMRKKYATEQISYNESLFKELLDVAKNNVAVSSDGIIRKINSKQCLQKSHGHQQDKKEKVPVQLTL